MKFLCLPCDAVMDFTDRQLPGDGTLTAVFICPDCGRETAMLANPMETQVVSSLGVQIGGRTVPDQPLEQVRRTMAEPREDALAEAAPSHADSGTVTWSEDAVERLGRVPKFVRGMVKRIYTDYARERGITVITVEVMDRARSELGLEGM